MNKNNIWISPSGDKWKTQREGSGRASGLFDTQREAEQYGRDLLQKGPGGELITQSVHGPIRSKDTINNIDNNPPKDREN